MIPEEFKYLVEHEPPFQEVAETLMICFVLNIATWVQQLNTSRLVIKRFVTLRQQNQLELFFQSSKDAILLYTEGTKLEFEFNNKSFENSFGEGLEMA